MTHVWSVICKILTYILTHFPDSSDGKESACNEADPGSIPGFGRLPGEGSDVELISMNAGARCAKVLYSENMTCFS